MCMEDLRIGLHSNGDVIPVTVGATAGNVLPPDSNRRSITFYPPLAGTITYMPRGTIGASGAGLNVTVAGSPITITLEIQGRIVQSGWQAIGSGAGLLAAIVTSELPDILNYDPRRATKYNADSRRA